MTPSAPPPPEDWEKLLHECLASPDLELTSSTRAQLLHLATHPPTPTHALHDPGDQDAALLSWLVGETPLTPTLAQTLISHPAHLKSALDWRAFLRVLPSASAAALTPSRVPAPRHPFLSLPAIAAVACLTLLALAIGTSSFFSQATSTPRITLEASLQNQTASHRSLASTSPFQHLRNLPALSQNALFPSPPTPISNAKLPPIDNLQPSLPSFNLESLNLPSFSALVATQASSPEDLTPSATNPSLPSFVPSGSLLVAHSTGMNHPAARFSAAPHHPGWHLSSPPPISSSLTPPGNAPTSEIPEPSSLLLAFISCLLLTRRHRMPHS